MNQRSIRRKMKKGLGMFWVALRLELLKTDPRFPRIPVHILSKRDTCRVCHSWSSTLFPTDIVPDDVFRDPRFVSVRKMSDGCQIFWNSHAVLRDGTVRYRADPGFEWLSECGDISLQRFLWETDNRIIPEADYLRATDGPSPEEVIVILGFKERGESKPTHKVASKIRSFLKGRRGRVSVLSVERVTRGGHPICP